MKVKWGKENYPDIELNTDEDPLVFKAQLFALTGVQPERQKVMLKGTTLKDSDWGNIKLKDVCCISLWYLVDRDQCLEKPAVSIFVHFILEDCDFNFFYNKTN